MSIRLFESETQDDQRADPAVARRELDRHRHGDRTTSTRRRGQGAGAHPVARRRGVGAAVARSARARGPGFLYVPRIDDEVLVAITQGNPEDAFVLGGLWNSSDGPPVDSGAEAV